MSGSVADPGPVADPGTGTVADPVRPTPPGSDVRPGRFRPGLGPGLRRHFRRYAATWLYLATFCVTGVIYALLSPSAQAAVLGWASTNVHNLAHDPVGCLIASAFFAAGGVSLWPGIIALTLFGANRALGNWRMVVTCAAGNIIGSLVSEGILWYQIRRGTMPASDRFIVDVGPSYVVVAAIAVALIWGSWPARVAAAAAFGGLIFVGKIFSGLSSLTVTPVGHATALLVGATLGSLLAWQRHRSAALS
jgi:rhomboid family protein